MFPEEQRLRNWCPEVHGPEISDALETLGRDLESEGLSEETERGQAWETRVAGASFVFPSECVLVP